MVASITINRDGYEEVSQTWIHTEEKCSPFEQLPPEGIGHTPEPMEPEQLEESEESIASPDQ